MLEAATDTVVVLVVGSALIMVECWGTAKVFTTTPPAALLANGWAEELGSLELFKLTMVTPPEVLVATSTLVSEEDNFC